MITFEEYQAFQDRGFSHAPLIKKRLMDAQTPVSVFSKVRDLSGSAYLFESVVGGERWARYSMIGLGNDLILQYSDGIMTVKKNDRNDVDEMTPLIIFVSSWLSIKCLQRYPLM